MNAPASTAAVTRADAGVLIDFRAPEAIRIGLAPLPTSFVEVWDALHIIRTLAG